MATIPTTIQERVPIPSSGSGSAVTSKAITPADLLRMLKQRLITIIILSLLFGAIGIGLFFLAYFKYPQYSSDALIECISDAPQRALTLEQTDVSENRYTRFVQSQAMFIKSYPILSTVLKDPEVRATQWYQDVPQGEHLIELEEDLGCAPARGTNYIRVAMATRSQADPHVIVNTVVKTYLDEARNRATAQYRQELSDYRREYSEVKDQIREKQEQIQAFKQTLPPGEAVGREQLGQGPLLEKLKKDQETVAELELQTAELESLMDIYNDPAGEAVTPDDRLAVEQDPRVATLDSQIFALEQEILVLESDFGPNHREYHDMQRRIEQARRQLEAARARKLREVLEQKRQQIETAFYNSQNSLLMARERLQESQAQQADLERKLSELRVLQDEMDLLVEIQNRIDEYVREIERIVQERTAVRVQSAVSASKPLQRSFPSLVLLPVIVVGAIGLSVALGLGLELIDTSMKTPQDIVRHLNISLLGSIPDVDDEEVDIERVETAVHDAPHSMVTEAFRSIRSNLQFSAPAERMRSILVTSPKPEDGRTTIAANLAVSMAIGGRRVLLVDANFRRPALHRIYPQADGKGMTNILIGEATFDACVRTTDLANLDVLGSGPIPPNPAELLGSDLCRRLLEEVTGKYDHVIFDSPPVLLASDATVLATLVDGTILVFRAKDNSRGVAQRACTLLLHVNAHLFGAILNGAQVRRGGYFREQLRTFYEYQAEDELPDRRGPALPGHSEEPAGDDEDKQGR